MAGRLLVSVILVASFFAALARCEIDAGEPAFPELLGPDNSNPHKIHILSEIIDSSGGYKLAEELVDLDAGKAAYMETKDSVRSSWLIDVNENTIYGYKPYSCEKSNLDLIGIRLPPIYDPISMPRIVTPTRQPMSLYGIVAILKTFSESFLRRYSKIVGHNQRVQHIWSISESNNLWTVKLHFSEQANVGGNKLSLESIEILQQLQKTTIKILSISHDITPENHNKLELPLIYGCKRSKIYDDDMYQKFDIISFDQTNRYHLKAQARALSFTGSNPTSTEQTDIELAMSNSHDGTQKRLLMVRQENSRSNLKSLIDYTYGIKFEADFKEGKCEISKIRSSSGSQPAVLRFSDELSLDLGNLESMLYGVDSESFIKVEKRGQNQYAYFAKDFLHVFGPGKVGRVVRKYSFGENGLSKLDSVAIWIFSSEHGASLTIHGMFEINFIENKPLLSDVDNTEAFDMSQECYIGIRTMVNGRDYVWASLTYETDQVEELKSRVVDLKNAFYQQIKTNLKLNYLRVPKMEITFGDSSFTVWLLVLDSLAPHLIYEQVDSYAINPKDVKTSTFIANLEKCSDLCRQYKCVAMTFFSAHSTCSVATQQSGELESREGAVSYISGSRDVNIASLSDLGLDEQAASISPGGQNMSEIIGFDELNHSQITIGPDQFRNLRVAFSLNGQSLELTPTNLQVVATNP